jgi:hypothetical protein
MARFKKGEGENNIHRGMSLRGKSTSHCPPGEIKRKRGYTDKD